MFSRFIINKNLRFSRLLSSLSKNYICDSSAIEAYKTNEKFKSIIDRQEHQFYYHADNQIKQQPSSVFKQIPIGSHPPENSHYITDSTSDQTTTKISVDEFIKTTLYNDRGKGRFPGLVGLEILSISNGYVSSQLKIREELIAPNGYLHAGVLVTLADTACGYGCMSSKPSQAKSFTTIELKSNFMGTVKSPAVITCEARLVHGGKTTQVWDAEIKDSEKKKLIAVFRCTELIIY